MVNKNFDKFAARLTKKERCNIRNKREDITINSTGIKKKNNREH